MPLFRLHTRATELAFAEQRRVDPFGHRLHAFLAALWCFLACSPTSIVEIGLIPVLLCYAIRAPRHLAVDARLIHLTAAQLATAWVAWLGLSTTWSLNRTLGLEELIVCRFALSLVLLWPVLDRRSWLIAGLIAGFFAANLAQVVHGVGVAFDIPSLRFPRMPHRNSGWWQPVVGGSMLTAALGLHLPALLTGSLRARLLGFIGSTASLLGVLATGSRGAWLASAALIFIAVIWSIARGWRAARRAAPSEPGAPPAGFRLGHLPLVIAALFLLSLAGYRTLWPSLYERADAGITEVRRAVNNRDYSTDTGARLLMAEVAIEAFKSSPVHGVGAGSFRTWGRAWLIAQHRDDDATRLHNHAHNTSLHIAASTGVVGLLLFVALVLLSLRGGLWRPPELAPAPFPTPALSSTPTPSPTPTPESPPSAEPTAPLAPESPALASAPLVHGPPLAGYELGPAFALLGLALVSPFDVIPTNAQTAALFWILVTLCFWGRPAAPR